MKMNTSNLTIYFCFIFQNVEVKKTNVKTNSSTYHHLCTFVNREVDTKQVIDFFHDSHFIISLSIEVSYILFYIYCSQIPNLNSSTNCLRVIVIKKSFKYALNYNVMLNVNGMLI